jgi:hypothetical protein
MMDRVLTEVSYSVYGRDGHQNDLERQRINSNHNFTQQEHHFGEDIWVTRKEHPESFHSAPHGAGRRIRAPTLAAYSAWTT